MVPLTLKVRDILESGVIALESNQTAREALRSMMENDVWSIVVNVNGVPSGVVTERDLLKRVIAKNLNIDKVLLKDIMSCPLITIKPDATFGEAWDLMVEKNVRRLYVIDKGKIIGRVTQTGLFKKLLDVLLALASLKYTL
ncbi:MAG: CBS domain-containing protein [Candidatus Bathyarchaeia archaeon]